MSNKQKILGNLKRGLLFIVSAPAGGGKTTLVRMLQEEFSCIRPSISCTTRKKREGESNGKDYHFITKEAFFHEIEQDNFLEHVLLFDNYYGTRKKDVEKLLEKGYHVFLVIDTHGTETVRKKCKCVTIFIQPPSIQELEKRLRLRGSETAQSLHLRLQEAERELCARDTYDYLIVNDDRAIAYQALRSIVIAEEHKSIYYKGTL